MKHTLQHAATRCNTPPLVSNIQWRYLNTRKKCLRQSIFTLATASSFCWGKKSSCNKWYATTFLISFTNWLLSPKKINQLVDDMPQQSKLERQPKKCIFLVSMGFAGTQRPKDLNLNLSTELHSHDFESLIKFKLVSYSIAAALCNTLQHTELNRRDSLITLDSFRQLRQYI